jgi:membrane protease YdiL (CAAX protease family)
MPMPIDPTKPTPQLIVLGLFFLLLVGLIGLTWLVALVRLQTRQPLLPDRPGRLVPWTGWSIAILVVFWVGIQAAVSYAAYQERKPANPAPAAAKPPKKPSLEVPPGDEVKMMAIISLFLVPLVPMTLRATCRAKLVDLGLGKFRLGDVAFGIVGCLFVMPITTLLMVVLSRFIKPTPHKLIEAVQGDQSGMMALLAIFSAVIAAPIVEELFFRGVVLAWLHTLGSRAKPTRPTEFVIEEDPLPRSENPYQAPAVATEPNPGLDLRRILGMHGGWVVPNVLTSVVFAGLHYQQWPAPIALLPLSLMLGYLYQRTGSLFAPIAMHATFNGINMAFLFLALWAGAPLGEPPEKAPVVDPVSQRPDRSDENRPAVTILSGQLGLAGVLCLQDPGPRTSRWDLEDKTPATLPGIHGHTRLATNSDLLRDRSWHSRAWSV